MIDEILKEVATSEDIKDTIVKHVLLWAHRVEAQREQKSALNYIKEAKYFDIIRHSMQR